MGAGDPAKHQYDFQFPSETSTKLNFDRTGVSSTRLPVFGDMESKDASDHHEASVSDASDCRISESTVAEKILTPLAQMTLFDQMESENTSNGDASESNVSNLAVTEHTVVSPTFENMESQNTPGTNTSESDVPENTTALSNQLPLHDNMEAKDVSESDLTGDATTPLEQQLPLLDRMELKTPLNPFLTDLTSEPNVTDPETSDSKGASDPDASDPNVTEPYASTSDVAESTTALVGEAFRTTDESIERYRQFRQRKAREREYRTLGNSIGCDLSDQQLHKILLIPPSERNEWGFIVNMDYVFQWVPREHQGLPIPDKNAQNILHRATEKAVSRRLKQSNESIKGRSYAHTDENCFNLTASWYGERPELPESLKDVPTIWLNNSERYDEQRCQIIQWIRERNDQRRQYRTMAQDLGDKISDEQLRDIIQRLQSERNEHGNIIEMNHIFQSLPLENEGSVDNKSAVDIIRAAIDIAVYKRLSHIDSNPSYYANLTKNAYTSITAHWSSTKPELPDPLKNISALIVFSEKSTNPDDFRYDCGVGCRIGQSHIPPSQHGI